MKKYVTPEIQTVQLRAEESVAVAFTGCTGYCEEDMTIDGFTYYGQTYS